MASLKDIRRRIASVKSTQKITRAMKLVAAGKLRKAQEAIFKARPYANGLKEMISDLVARTEASDHPLLEARPVQEVALFVITSERGHCGAFNGNVVRRAERWIVEQADQGKRVRLFAVGKKGREYFKYRGQKIERDFSGIDIGEALDRARETSAWIVNKYLRGEADQVSLIFNEFRSAVSQRVVVETLLPIKLRELPPGSGSVEFLFEPNKDQILESLLPLHLRIEMGRAFLESAASENGARMTAMENATKSATEMMSNLTLQYNKARQALITTELGEIVGGAEAMKG